jgi:hypothetical protein
VLGAGKEYELIGLDLLQDGISLQGNEGGMQKRVVVVEYYVRRLERSYLGVGKGEDT